MATVLARSALVSSEVENVNGVELVGQGEPHPVVCVGVEPAAVANEGDDAAVADAHGGPAECADVRVVQVAGERGARASDVAISQ
jgi:hypothetical protein